MYVVEKIGLSRIITRLLFSVPGVYLMDTRICVLTTTCSKYMILKYDGKQMSQKGNNEFYKLFEEIPHIFEFILSLTNRHLVGATVWSSSCVDRGGVL